MKVFISWSGNQSYTLAKALHEWLPLVLHYVDPWLSQSDIDAGERWGTKIAKELETTNFGIICVTKENTQAPWLLFEAGALAKSMEDGKVIPLLLDIDFQEISGPLAQFQAKKVEKQDILNVISAINKVATNPVDTRLAELFASLWPRLETKINAIPKKETSPKSTRTHTEVLEELVARIRGLEMKLRDNPDDDRMRNKYRKVKFFQVMAARVLSQISDTPDDPTRILLIASLLRDDIPWLYELGIEAYRAFRSGRIEEAQLVHRKFLNAIKIIRRDPFFTETLDQNTHMLLREILATNERSLYNFDTSLYENETKKKILDTEKN